MASSLKVLLRPSLDRSIVDLNAGMHQDSTPPRPNKLLNNASNIGVNPVLVERIRNLLLGWYAHMPRAQKVLRKEFRLAQAVMDCTVPAVSPCNPLTSQLQVPGYQSQSLHFLSKLGLALTSRSHPSLTYVK